MPTNTTIRFLNHYVTNGTVKARVWYSLDNHVRHARCVTLYAKTYSRELGEIFTTGEYQNDTDSQVDYFDKGRVTLAEGHPLYAAARAAAEKVEASRATFRLGVESRRKARADAKAAELLQPWPHGHIYSDPTCRCSRCVDRRVAGISLLQRQAG